MDVNQARSLLEAEARRLDQVAAGAARSLGDDRQPDPITAGTDLTEQELDITLVHRVERERAEVHAAQARLAAGIYGRCQSCGTAIADERLEAVPATRFCREHELDAESLLEGDGVGGFDDGTAAANAVRREAQENLDLLPHDDLEGDDDADRFADDTDRSAEDEAVHLRP